METRQNVQGYVLVGENMNANPHLKSAPSHTDFRSGFSNAEADLHGFWLIHAESVSNPLQNRLALIWCRFSNVNVNLCELMWTLPQMPRRIHIKKRHVSFFFFCNVDFKSASGNSTDMWFSHWIQRDAKSKTVVWTYPNWCQLKIH